MTRLERQVAELQARLDALEHAWDCAFLKTCNLKFCNCPKSPEWRPQP